MTELADDFNLAAVSAELGPWLSRILGPEGKDLVRRGAIETGGDGWPTRTAHIGVTDRTLTETYPIGRDWYFRCHACTVRFDGYYDTQAQAQAAADRHLLDTDHAAVSTIDYADPTGEMAVSMRLVKDPVRANRQRFLNHLDRLREAARMCVLELDQALPNRKAAGDDDSDWCRNHLTIGAVEPRYRGKGETARPRCRYCYDFNAEHGCEPPAWVMQRRQADGKVTPRLATEIEKWLVLERQAKGKKRKTA